MCLSALLYLRSGLRLKVTTKLRRYDVGVLALGTVAFSLKPNTPNQSLGNSW